jgi:hypothetical protein
MPHPLGEGGACAAGSGRGVNGGIRPAEPSAMAACRASWAPSTAATRSSNADPQMRQFAAALAQANHAPEPADLRVSIFIGSREPANIYSAIWVAANLCSIPGCVDSTGNVSLC